MRGSIQPTHSGTVSRGARLYIPLARYALQSLNLLLDSVGWLTNQPVLGAWLRITQSSSIVTIPGKGPHEPFDCMVGSLKL
jgi:hypothetical protein